MVRATVDDVRMVSYLADLPANEAARIAESLVVVRVPPRELVFGAGDRTLGFYVVRSGKGRIFRTSADGREQTLRLTGPGDSFGEVPVFDGRPAPSSVQALESMELLLVPTEVLREVILRHPVVAVRLLEHFARRIRGLTDLVEQISLQTVESRLARYLYQLVREEGVRMPDGYEVPRELTQQDLATIVGSVREVVGRTLKVMEHDGLLRIERRRFVILDLERLRAMV